MRKVCKPCVVTSPVQRSRFIPDSQLKGVGRESGVMWAGEVPSRSRAFQTRKKKINISSRSFFKVQTTVQGWECHSVLPQPLRFWWRVQCPCAREDKASGLRKEPGARLPPQHACPLGFCFGHYDHHLTPVSSHIKYYKTNRMRISTTDYPPPVFEWQL